MGRSRFIHVAIDNRRGREREREDEKGKERSQQREGGRKHRGRIYAWKAYKEKCSKANNTLTAKLIMKAWSVCQDIFTE